MLFKKDELKLLWPFYLYYLVFGLSTMIMPFMIIYFVNLGFSFFQIALITSAFGIAMFLFEVPTGAFADSFSRKYSVILGFLITAFAVILIPLMTNFYLLLFMWVLAGIGMTFVSGAEESWVIDNLNKFKRNDLHQEFFIKSSSLAAFGAIFAPFVGALLVKSHSINILWFIFGFGFLLNAILLMIFGQEYYKPKRLKIFEAVKETYLNCKRGLRFTTTHKIIFLIVLAGLFNQLMVIGDNGWQPFLVSLGMAEYQLGYMYSIMAAVVMVMPFLSKLFVNFKPKNAVSIIVFVRMVLLFSLIFIYPPLFFLAAIIFIMDAGLFSMKDPIIQTYFHKFIPEKIRATVVSTKSMFSQLIIALAALIAGVFLDIFGPQKVLVFGSLFGIIAIILYQKIKD
jgi:MFS family permease